MSHPLLAKSAPNRTAGGLCLCPRFGAIILGGETTKVNKRMQEEYKDEFLVKSTKTLGTLVIKRVSKELAKEMIIANHYSHKWNGGFGVYSYGIYRAEDLNRCLGVAAYGYMKNPRAKIFEHPNPKAWMIELNRMWISDELGHNAETVLIGASLKLLRRADPNIVAVQSFADGRLGCGTIYKASNFDYFGYHRTIFLRNKRSGEVVHQQILTDTTAKTGYLRANMAYLLGDFDIFRVKTYRYIYVFDRRNFRFSLKQQASPPYERGEEPFDWGRDREAIKAKMAELLTAI